MAGERSYSTVVLNLLIAFAISLTVNFSYALLFLVERPAEDGMPPHFRNENGAEIAGTGRLSVSADGHGYILFGGGGVDSVYITAMRVKRLGLSDGDMMKIRAIPPHGGGHMRFAELLELNGEPFDYGTVYQRPKEGLLFALQILYFFAVAFVMLTLLSGDCSGRFGYWRRSLSCILLCGALYFVAPVAEWHSGRIAMLAGTARLLDYNMILKSSFALVVSLLYGRIYRLIRQQQAIVLENERLKTENLSTRYNMLVSQINPHFFFNSLNSLAMLVREGDGDRALTYIDQLSYTFRYIIRNGQNVLSTLGEELKFADAYSYLFRIRYADKLFFDVDVDERLSDWRLPALTLQPLIGNAVKHNAITKARPFHVSIRTEGGYLVVSNPRIPKLDPEPGTGIGLRNLGDRYRMITGRTIEITQTADTFTVRVPLVKPSAE